MIIIKSQNETEIREVDNLWIYEKCDGNYSVATTHINEHQRLGTYKTKERAQEVLDQIWWIITNTAYGFYEMPKE